MPRLSRILRICSVAAVLALVGCSSNPAPQDGPIVGEGGDARVDVTNHNWLDMTVYAVRGSMRVRLGTVTSMNREILTIPSNLLASAASVQLIASPIGSSADYATYPVDVWPGETIEFKIENNLGTSNVSR